MLCKVEIVSMAKHKTEATPICVSNGFTTALHNASVTNFIIQKGDEYYLCVYIYIYI